MISETRERLLAVERELDAIYNHVRSAPFGLRRDVNLCLIALTAIREWSAQLDHEQFEKEIAE
jgi:hypothetical protein